MITDAGEWKCEVERYHASGYRGYGYKRTGVMEIGVLIANTSKVITSNEESKTTSWEFESTKSTGKK